MNRLRYRGISLGDRNASDARLAAGGAVALAAALIVANILLGLLIARRSRRITNSLDRIRENTGALFDLPELNASLGRITKELREVRTGESA